MPVMTGGLVDAGQAPMTGLRARMFWVLNRSTLHAGIVVASRPIEAIITGERFSINVEPTGVGEWYTIQVQWVNADGDPVGWTDLDRKIQVPEEGGDLSGTSSVIISPDKVYVSLYAPNDAFPYWLQAAIGDPDAGTSTGSGDLYRRVE